MADQRRRLILFARFPVVGKVKTRLIPALGADGAAALHRRLVLRTLRTAHTLCQSRGVELEIRFAGDNANEMQHWLGDGWPCRSQCEGDLGQRMAGAYDDSFREGSLATVIIGSDCPSLTPEILWEAFESLRAQPAVFGPATDGGYYLIGLNRPRPELFQGIVWGTETVLTRSVEILNRFGITPRMLPHLDDIDRPEDVPRWSSLVEPEEADLKSVSVIIPALNEAAHLVATLAAVNRGSPREVVVVDGGSTDATWDLAQAAGATVIRSAPGRARQMNAGAARATSSTLLFLHADTVLPERWPDAVVNILAQSGAVAGAFAFRIAGQFPGRCWVEWTTNLRSRRLQLPYGDQGLFLRRNVFEALGGFANLHIMEDLDIVLRLRKSGNLITTAQPAITSGRRWQKLGTIKTTIINQAAIAGFLLKVDPGRLAGFYQRFSHIHIGESIRRRT